MKQHKYISASLDEVRNEVDVFVTGDIGWDFRAEDLMYFLSYYKDEHIVLNIYSGGGAVWDALAVYDYIKTNELDVESKVYGLAGSAATIIALAGNYVSIGENSFWFIHYAYYSNGKEADENINKINDRLISIYMKKTGIKKPAMKKMLQDGTDNNTIMTATEAKDLGFVDSKLKEVEKVAASYSIDNYRFEVKRKNMKLQERIIDFVNKVFGYEIEKESELNDELIIDALDDIQEEQKQLEESDEAIDLSEINNELTTLSIFVANMETKVEESVSATLNKYEDSINEWIAESTEKSEKKTEEQLIAVRNDLENAVNELRGKLNDLIQDVQNIRLGETDATNHDPTLPIKEKLANQKIVRKQEVKNLWQL